MKKSFVLQIFAVLLVFTGAGTGPAQGFMLSLDTSSITMPPPGRYDLDAGYLENASGQGIYALRIAVDAPQEARGWTLYTRATNAYFTPQSNGKSCQDLKWKFDFEGRNAYRPITIQDAPVMNKPGGGRSQQELDFLFLVDWSTPPASYSLNLLFTLVVE